MGNIFIVRHGETNLNFEERYQGLVDVPLNAEGVKQANLLGAYFKNLNMQIDTIVSSPLVRSLETTNILVSNILKKQKHIDIRISNDIKELHFGDFDGLRKKEVLELYPSFFYNNIYGFYTDYENKFPNGESLKDAYLRASNFCKEYDFDVSKNMIIVCHNGVNKMLRAYLTNSDPKDYILINQKHDEIIEINKNNFKEKSIKA